jgi:hypothetical protein
MALAPVLQFPSVRTVPSSVETTDRRDKDYLTAPEMNRLLEAAKYSSSQLDVQYHAAIAGACAMTLATDFVDQLNGCAC